MKQTMMTFQNQPETGTVHEFNSDPYITKYLLAVNILASDYS